MVEKPGRGSGRYSLREAWEQELTPRRRAAQQQDVARVQPTVREKTTSAREDLEEVLPQRRRSSQSVYDDLGLETRSKEELARSLDVFKRRVELLERAHLVNEDAVLLEDAKPGIRVTHVDTWRDDGNHGAGVHGTTVSGPDGEDDYIRVLWDDGKESRHSVTDLVAVRQPRAAGRAMNSRVTHYEGNVNMDHEADVDRLHEQIENLNEENLHLKSQRDICRKRAMLLERSHLKELKRPEPLKEFTSGVRVARGEDWKTGGYGDVDGGSEGTTVTWIAAIGGHEEAAQDEVEPGWIKVLWDNGNEGKYRISAEGRYDLVKIAGPDTGKVNELEDEIRVLKQQEIGRVKEFQTLEEDNLLMKQRDSQAKELFKTLHHDLAQKDEMLKEQIERANNSWHQVSIVQDQLAKLQQQNHSLNAEKTTLENQRHTIEHELRSVKSLLDETKSKTVDEHQERRLAALKQENANSTDRQRDLEKQLSSLHGQLNQLNLELSRSTSDRNRLEDEKRAVQSALDAETQRAKALEEKMGMNREAIEDHHARRLDLEKEVEQLRAELRRQENFVRRLNEEKQTAAECQQTLEEQIQTLKEHGVERHKLKLETLQMQDKISRLEVEKSELNNLLEEEQAERRRVEEDVTSHAENARALKAQMESEQMNMHTLKRQASKHHELESDNARLRTSLAACEDAERKNVELEEKLAKMAKAFDTFEETAKTNHFRRLKGPRGLLRLRILPQWQMVVRAAKEASKIQSLNDTLHKLQRHVAGQWDSVGQLVLDRHSRAADQMLLHRSLDGWKASTSGRKARNLSDRVFSIQADRDSCKGELAEVREELALLQHESRGAQLALETERRATQERERIAEERMQQFMEENARAWRSMEDVLPSSAFLKHRCEWLTDRCRRGVVHLARIGLLRCTLAWRFNARLQSRTLELLRFPWAVRGPSFKLLKCHWGWRRVVQRRRSRADWARQVCWWKSPRWRVRPAMCFLIWHSAVSRGVAERVLEKYWTQSDSGVMHKSVALRKFACSDTDTAIAWGGSQGREPARVQDWDSGRGLVSALHGRDSLAYSDSDSFGLVPHETWAQLGDSDFGEKQGALEGIGRDLEALQQTLRARSRSPIHGAPPRMHSAWPDQGESNILAQRSLPSAPRNPTQRCESVLQRCEELAQAQSFLSREIVQNRSLASSRTQCLPHRTPRWNDAETSSDVAEDSWPPPPWKIPDPSFHDAPKAPVPPWGVHSLHPEHLSALESTHPSVSLQEGASAQTHPRKTHGRSKGSVPRSVRRPRRSAGTES